MFDDGAELYDDLIHPPVTGPRPDTIAGRYVLGDVLGRGHSGEVFAAVDRFGERPVAVKLFYPGRHLPTREVLALRGLRVPGVVRLLDDGVDGGRAFLVMERARGRPFPGPRRVDTWEAMRPIVGALLDVLGRLHRLDLLHLDLKPDNVLVDEYGRVTVLDFGLVAGEGLGRAQPVRIGGNDRYAAPEQRAGGRVDGRADLFAVACMVRDSLDGPLPIALRRAASPELDGRPSSARALRHALEPPASSTAAPAPPVGQIFAGSNRILPLVDDASALIEARAGQDLGARRAVIDGWRSAVGAQPGAPIRVTPEDLDTLRYEAFDLPELPPWSGAPHHDVALTLTTLAWPSSHRPMLTAALDELEIEPSTLDDLVEVGALLPIGDRLRPMASPPNVASRPLHDALAAAMPIDHPRRMRHLIAGRRSGDFAGSAIGVACAHESRGRLSEASDVLDRALRRQPDHEDLLRCRARVALQGRALSALDQGLYMLGRAGPQHDVAQRLTTLLRVARSLMRGDIDRAQALHGELPSLVDVQLDQWRVALGLMIAAAQGAEAEAAAWATAQSRYGAHPRWRGHLLKWRGRLRYDLGHFAEAAEDFVASAEFAETEVQRVDRLLNAASAALEAPQAIDGHTIIERALHLARATRHAHYAGRAAWLERCWRYRRGDALGPDTDLLSAAEGLDLPPYLCGLIALNESAVGWRAGRLDDALSLSRRAADAFGAARHEAGEALARALYAAAGGSIEPDELAQRAEAATRAGWADIDWQVVGLAALRVPSLRTAALEMAARVEDPKRRRDVLAPADLARLLAPS